ncbi:hypothetical protein Hanom_Chr13g01235411 [Helianthus anomalus]
MPKQQGDIRIRPPKTPKHLHLPLHFHITHIQSHTQSMYKTPHPRRNPQLFLDKFQPIHKQFRVHHTTLRVTQHKPNNPLIRQPNTLQHLHICRQSFHRIISAIQPSRFSNKLNHILIITQIPF